jgi:hypothetical protein
MNVPMNYVEPPTVPEGMTLREWNRLRCAAVAAAAVPPRRRGLRARLRLLRHRH